MMKFVDIDPWAVHHDGALGIAFSFSFLFRFILLHVHKLEMIHVPKKYGPVHIDFRSW